LKWILSNSIYRAAKKSLEIAHERKKVVRKRGKNRKIWSPCDIILKQVIMKSWDAGKIQLLNRMNFYADFFDIATLPELLLFSINHKSGDIWFSVMISQV
jgi:hypothetical protein